MGNSCGGARRVLGRDSHRTPGSRAGSCGTGSTRRSCRRSTTAPSGSPTAATSATSRTTAPFCLRRAGRRRPHAAPVAARAREGDPAGADPRRRRRRAACSLCTNEHAFVDLAWLQPSWVVHVDGDEVARGRARATPYRARRHEQRGDPPSDARALGRPARASHARRCRPAPSFRGRPPVTRSRGSSSRSRRSPASPARRARSRQRRDRSTHCDPSVTVWRAPIDNETFGPGSRCTLGAARPERRDRAVRRQHGEPTGRLRHHVMHTVVDSRRPRRPPARSACASTSARACDAVEWLGAGPHECYSDRRASARVGRWITLVDDWPVAYVHPQASGNRIDVRWLRFLDADGEPLLTIDELDDLQVTVARVDRRGARRRRPSRRPARTRRLLRVDRRPAAWRRLRPAVPTPRPRTGSVPAPTAGRIDSDRRYAHRASAPWPVSSCVRSPRRRAAAMRAAARRAPPRRPRPRGRHRRRPRRRHRDTCSTDALRSALRSKRATSWSPSSSGSTK